MEAPHARETVDGEGLALAAAVFSGESLMLPFVPEVLAGSVRSRAALIFGTREAEAGQKLPERVVRSALRSGA